MVLAGCGGGGSTGTSASRPAPARLTSTEVSRVAEYEYDFSLTVLDGSHYAGTLKGVDYLIALCRAKPRARYQAADETPRTVMQVTEDAANTLREYQRALAAKLDRVLDDDCR